MVGSIGEKEKNHKRIFISYSWDSDEHKNRVFQFASKLRSKGFDVILDKDMMYGDRMTHFMEKAVIESDIVLFICTPEYKQRADGRKGGVGYESSIITGELYETQNERKFIPVLFSGSWTESMPNWAKGKLGVDLRDDDNKQYSNLLYSINNLCEDNIVISSLRRNTSTLKIVKIFVIIFIIVLIIALVIFALHRISRINDDLAARIKDMESRFNHELEQQIEMIYNIEASLYDSYEYTYQNVTLNPPSSSGPIKLAPSSQFTDEILLNYTSANNLLASNMLLDATAPIAYDINSEKVYTAKELANEQLLFTYSSGTQDIFFLAQFSEEGQLDGNCIINIYDEDALTLITDAQYDNGILLKYSQVFSCIAKSGHSVWSVSKQIPYNDYSSGETWYYKHNNDYRIMFDANNIAPKNIVTADEFHSKINTDLERYYCGNTSNGYFNDSTGRARMVIFSEDRTVNTIYVGNFRDGQFDDFSGNAWIITKSDTDYLYFIGKFTHGEMIDQDYRLEIVSLKRIEEIVDKSYFNCDLKWSGGDSVTLEIR